MKERTPDQIRQQTVPKKHEGLIYGFLGGFLGAVVWFGGWGLLHREQVRRYPEYCQHAFHAEVESIHLFGPVRPRKGMSAERLRYELLRYGNLEHQYDSEIVIHGWYPKGAAAKSWVFYFGAVRPIYSDSPMMVFKWPITLTLLTCIVSLVFGLLSDFRYKKAVIAGIPLDGSVVATVDEYVREVQGDGMAYTVKPWKDR